MKSIADVKSLLPTWPIAPVRGRDKQDRDALRRESGQQTDTPGKDDPASDDTSEHIDEYA